MNAFPQTIHFIGSNTPRRTELSVRNLAVEGEIPAEIVGLAGLLRTPEVVEVMAELGMDLAERQPQKLTQADAEWADVVVTMGCGDECPRGWPWGPALAWSAGSSVC